MGRKRFSTQKKTFHKRCAVFPNGFPWEIFQPGSGILVVFQVGFLQPKKIRWFSRTSILEVCHSAASPRFCVLSFSSGLKPPTRWVWLFLGGIREICMNCIKKVGRMHHSIKNWIWDRIPTDPETWKLRSSYEIRRFFPGPWTVRSDHWRFLGFMSFWWWGLRLSEDWSISKKTSTKCQQNLHSWHRCSKDIHIWL